MQKRKSAQLRTPIRKWQQISPMQDQLAIVQSDLSSPEQPELFTSLVGTSPFQHTPRPSSPYSQEEYSQSFSSFPFSPQESMQEEIPVTVRDMNSEEVVSTERLPLKALDHNRKGCNCRNSKCEKNYCDCLKMGLVCQPGLCCCEDCHNQQEKQIHRTITRKLEVEEPQQRGCRCKRSRCLKKYCECHSGGRKCSALCECVECHNRDENQRPEAKREASQRLRRPLERQTLIY